MDKVRWAQPLYGHDEPLDVQVSLLLDWICGTKPQVRRTVPVQWHDTDVLLIDVLRKLIPLALRGAEHTWPLCDSKDDNA